MTTSDIVNRRFDQEYLSNQLVERKPHQNFKKLTLALLIIAFVGGCIAAAVGLGGLGAYQG